MVGLMIGDAGTVMEGTVREGIIRPTGTRGVVAIGPTEFEKNKIVILRIVLPILILMRQ